MTDLDNLVLKAGKGYKKKATDTAEFVSKHLAGVYTEPMSFKKQIVEWKDYFKTVTDRSKKVKYPEGFKDVKGKATLAPLSLIALYTKDAINFAKTVGEQMYAKEKDPQKMTEIALGIMGASYPGAPKGSATLGTLKKVGTPQRKVIREAMKQEFKARGPVTKTTTDLANAPLDELTDHILRGEWYHGRKTYPKPGETFGQSRVGHSHLGEPYGISLTANPDVLKGHFAKTPAHLEKGYYKLAQKGFELQDKAIKLSDVEHKFTKEMKNFGKVIKKAKELGLYDEYTFKLRIHPEKTQFTRALPKFEGKPSDKVLPAWMSEETQWAQDILKETYIETLRKQPDLFKPKQYFVKIPGEKDLIPVSESNVNWLDTLNKSSKEQFTALKKLRNDYRMGDLKKVFELYDKGAKPVIPDELKLTADWRSRVDEIKFNKDMAELLQEKGYKGLLYSPARYKEYELRMLNPEDVMRMDIRRMDDPAIERLHRKYGSYFDYKRKGPLTGKQTKRLEAWETRTIDAPASLRDIYNTMDLTDLPLIPKTPETLAEKFGLQYQGKWPDLDMWEFMDLETKGNISVTNLDELEEKVIKLKESMKGISSISAEKLIDFGQKKIEAEGGIYEGELGYIKEGMPYTKEGIALLTKKQAYEQQLKLNQLANELSGKMLTVDIKDPITNKLMFDKGTLLSFDKLNKLVAAGIELEYVKDNYVGLPGPFLKKP